MKEASDSVRHQEVGIANSELQEQSPDSLFELYQNAGAERFGLALEEFAEILRQVAGKCLTGNRDDLDGLGDQKTTSADTSEFYASLHLEELALARACAKGSEQAWEAFLTRYREKLYDAARSMAREESQARELADSLYADLFGMGKDGAPRVSKLSFYTGRGSLEGWLKTVMAQEHVNRYRSQRRLVSLEEQAEAGVQFRAREPEPVPALDGRVERATDEALAALPSEDRFILAAYYLDGRTLAEVALTLGVHESTISRKVEKITRSTRKGIVAGLVRLGMSRAQAEEALDADVRDFSINVRDRLAEGKAQEKDG
jgi:RNA polymerase sigma-70 factor, ECF subfamily